MSASSGRGGQIRDTNLARRTGRFPPLAHPRSRRFSLDRLVGPSDNPILTRMSLPPGARLGPYEILSPLGKGGMGEVYRARDTRLSRTAAAQGPPSQWAQSAESRDRFEREARLIASLNHPHICTLHDVGREG